MDIGATSLATAEAQRSGEGPRRPQRAGRAARRHRALESRRDQQRPRRGRYDPERQLRRRLRADASRSAHPDHGHHSRAKPRTTPALVASLVDAGMDVARINCAHDDPAAWARMAANVRAAASAAGRQRPRVDGPSRPEAAHRARSSTGRPVGRARVTRDESGHVLAPARIWLTSAHTPAPPPIAERSGKASGARRSMSTSRGSLPVSRGRRDHHPARRPGPERTFTVTDVSARTVRWPRDTTTPTSTTVPSCRAATA